MELELEVKITQARDGHTRNIQITKDNSPIFSIKETDSMFFLIGNLPGFKKESIKIEIDNGGTLITIRGGKREKLVQEMVLAKLAVYKRVDMKGFKKVFRIPQGVILDRIRARFEEDGILIVSMPKLSPGKIQGILIEEVEIDEVDGGDRESGLAIEVTQEKVADRPVTQEDSKEKHEKEEHGAGKPEDSLRELQMPEAPLMAEEDTRVWERKPTEASAMEIQEVPYQEEPEAPVVGEEQRARVSEKEMSRIPSIERQQEEEIADQEKPTAPAMREEQELGVSEEEIPEASAMGTQEEFPHQDIPEPPSEEVGQEFGVLEKEIPEASMVEIQERKIPDQEKTDVAAVEQNQEPVSPVPEIPAAIETEWSRQNEDIPPETEQEGPEIIPMDEKPDPGVDAFEVLESSEIKIPEVPNNHDLETQRKMGVEPALPEIEIPEASSSEQNQDEEITEMEILVTEERPDPVLPNVEEPGKLASELPKVELPEAPLVKQEQDQMRPIEQKPDKEFPKVEAQEATPNQEHKLEARGQKQDEKPPEIEMKMQEQLPQMEISDREAPEKEIRYVRNQNKRDKSTQTPPGAPCCIPCILAGSAFIVSLIVLAMHILRNKRK